ncbi:MAG TPA: 23S rRNA (pseudouridine(1915)-N(3))-methyltransferase RlmH [Bacteriovoracaceae bacterium]|nr:23S rRNA (pseudouridine(1915)-N(3))-methyltransferase RlmH [Bacteriovoracaceae bacterium]
MVIRSSGRLNLIVVGKLKDPSLESIESDYRKRIQNPELNIHEVKASAENKQTEGEAILKKIRELAPAGGTYLIAMTEWGKRSTSVAFSDWFSQLIERPAKIFFIIAGAEGFSEEVLSVCQERISLSELTFPHKLARILLVEQLYRAQTIRSGHPYHN